MRRRSLRHAVGLCLLAAAPIAAQAPSFDQAPFDPVAPRGDDNRRTGETPILDVRVADLFGTPDQTGALPTARRGVASKPASDAVLSGQATGRQTSDAGDLLRQSPSAHGVDSQVRSPLVSETRVRGQRIGQVLASGSYWAPARMDLDTMLSKLDSRLVEDTILVKGPYSTRYGPGFRFVDVEFLLSPRNPDGYRTEAVTSLAFDTNGEQWHGRQFLAGAGADYGYQASYGHRTGVDYESGQEGFFLPSSYKSRDVFLAVGKDLSDHESIEFNVIRVDQTDVEFAGLVFDVNWLVTDGYEATYTNTAPGFADLFTAEVWYNRTRFEGDSTRPGKKIQQPDLDTGFEPPDGDDRGGAAFTDVDALSAGHRLESTYLLPDGRLVLGTDLIVLNQSLNDYEIHGPPEANNFPIPRSHQVDVGVYAEKSRRVAPRVEASVGVRGDLVVSDARDLVTGVPAPVSALLGAELDQVFGLAMAYATADVELTPTWTADFGAGYAQRAPTITELYALGPFIGSLQRGDTFLIGDPDLEQEQLFQLDAGLRYDDHDGVLSGGMHGHYAWVRDYITYELIEPEDGHQGLPQGADFVQTDLATLWGGEAYGQCQVTPSIAAFGVLSYVQGTDQTRRRPSEHPRPEDPDGGGGGGGMGPPPPSDGAGFPATEPLPGIPPLSARIGLRIEDPSPTKAWGVELSARIVDDQDRFAASLQEIATPGFTTYDLRTYLRQGDWLLTAGVENLTDKFYREHLDYRTGRGVYQPGFNYYTALEVAY